MKTRAEIYGNEAAALLRIVTMYPGLNMQQLLCFHPGKEEIIKTLLSHLQKQGRIFQTDTGGYFPSGWAAKSGCLSSPFRTLSVRRKSAREAGASLPMTRKERWQRPINL